MNYLNYKETRSVKPQTGTDKQNGAQGQNSTDNKSAQNHAQDQHHQNRTEQRSNGHTHA